MDSGLSWANASEKMIVSSQEPYVICGRAIPQFKCCYLWILVQLPAIAGITTMSFSIGPTLRVCHTLIENQHLLFYCATIALVSSSYEIKDYTYNESAVVDTSFASTNVASVTTVYTAPVHPVESITSIASMVVNPNRVTNCGCEDAHATANAVLVVLVLPAVRAYAKEVVLHPYNLAQCDLACHPYHTALQYVHLSVLQKDFAAVGRIFSISMPLDRAQEEEDENDKIALGREYAGDRLYVKDITDHGSYLNSHNVLPESFQDHTRDSRANLYAAKVRLKEDENAPASLESPEKSGKKVSVVVDSSLAADGGNLRSILKRKENQADTLQKRVRFDPTCKESAEEELDGSQQPLISSMETDTGVEDTYAHAVPDYVQNPSKYTRYTFDSESEVDDSSNREAYMDFLKTSKGRMSVDSQQEKTSGSPPKSVTFIPKKKTAPDNTGKKDISGKKPNQEDAWICKPPGILAAEVQENEVCAMEEDNPEISVESRGASSGKTGRRYRSKVQVDDSSDDVVS